MTVVDMGDLPESHVSITELSDLVNKWPPVVITHAMATAVVRGDSQSSESTISEETAGTVLLLWHPDQVRYVSACDTLPVEFNSIITVPSDVVFRLEGHATGLDGPNS